MVNLFCSVVDKGVKTILSMGIGGSADDGGIGMAAGLRVAFYDDQAIYFVLLGLRSVVWLE